MGSTTSVMDPSRSSAVQMSTTGDRVLRMLASERTQVCLVFVCLLACVHAPALTLFAMSMQVVSHAPHSSSFQRFVSFVHGLHGKWFSPGSLALDTRAEYIIGETDIEDSMSSMEVSALSDPDLATVRTVSLESPFFDYMAWHPTLCSHMADGLSSRFMTALKQATTLSCMLVEQPLPERHAIAMEAVSFGLQVTLSNLYSPGCVFEHALALALYRNGAIPAIADTCVAMSHTYWDIAAGIAAALVCMLPEDVVASELDALSDEQLDNLTASCIWSAKSCGMEPDYADIIAERLHAACRTHGLLEGGSVAFVSLVPWLLKSSLAGVHAPGVASALCYSAHSSSTGTEQHLRRRAAVRMASACYDDIKPTDQRIVQLSASLAPYVATVRKQFNIESKRAPGKKGTTLLFVCFFMIMYTY